MLQLLSNGHCYIDSTAHAVVPTLISCYRVVTCCAKPLATYGTSVGRVSIVPHDHIRKARTWTWVEHGQLNTNQKQFRIGSSKKGLGSDWRCNTYRFSYSSTSVQQERQEKVHFCKVEQPYGCCEYCCFQKGQESKANLSESEISMKVRRCSLFYLHWSSVYREGFRDTLKVIEGDA